jgi:hypothetical protein
MAATTVTVNSAVIIEEAGLGRPLINSSAKLESGYTPVEFDLLMEKNVVDITTQAVVGLSNVVVLGMTDANTLNGVLYGKIANGTGGAGDVFVYLYKDAARSAEVAKSDNLTRATMTVGTFAESNSSGITGTFSILAATANASDQVFTTRKEYSRYDRDNLTNQSIVGLVSFYDSELFQIECYSNPVKALIDGIGCDNVDGMFERDAMMKAALLKNITLV